MSETSPTENTNNDTSNKDPSLPKGPCAVCGAESRKRCSRCSLVFYCSAEHQKQDWKRHKRTMCNDAHQADQYTLHKREFDRIIKSYGLDSEQKSEEISQLLTAQGSDRVSAQEFADKFGTTPEEAVVFLEWIKVGVKFKEQSIDAAKKSGFSASTQR